MCASLNAVVEADAAVPAGAERDLLVDVVGVGLERVVRRHQVRDVDQVAGLGEGSGARVGHAAILPSAPLVEEAHGRRDRREGRPGKRDRVQLRAQLPCRRRRFTGNWPRTTGPGHRDRRGAVSQDRFRPCPTGPSSPAMGVR